MERQQERHHDEVQTSSSVRPVLSAYGLELRRWLRSESGDDGALYAAGVTLCADFRLRGNYPEQMLIELHRCGVTRRSEIAFGEVSHDRRYTVAIQLLLRTFAGLENRQRAD